jgi:hypothetical protein
MKKMFVIIIIFCVFSFPAFALDVQVFDSTDLAVRITNEYRVAPYQYLINHGVTEEEINSYYTESEIGFIKEGMQTLDNDSRLTMACMDHMKDMFTREYISHISPDNSTPTDRALLYGYKGYVDETILFIAFENYIKVEDAFRILINIAIKSTLSDNIDEGKHFNYPFYNNMGAALGVGELTIDNKPYHVYGMCLLFGYEGN